MQRDRVVAGAAVDANSVAGHMDLIVGGKAKYRYEQARIVRKCVDRVGGLAADGDAVIDHNQVRLRFMSRHSDLTVKVDQE